MSPGELRIREKLLAEDWPDLGLPAATEFRTPTSCSGVTNGSERSDLLGGNYATPDDRLPSRQGYQNVGRAAEVGANVQTVSVGDLLYFSADHMEYAVTPEDGLYVKLPSRLNPKHAALFGTGSVARHTCCKADLRLEVARRISAAEAILGLAGASWEDRPLSAARESTCSSSPVEIWSAVCLALSNGMSNG